jgi:hypothetical protein
MHKRDGTIGKNLGSVNSLDELFWYVVAVFVALINQNRKLWNNCQVVKACLQARKNLQHVTQRAGL